MDQKKAIEGVASYLQTSIKALKDSQGDNVTGTAPTLPQIWTKYGASPDYDSAKLFATRVYRHTVEALGTMLSPLLKVFEQQCDQLDKLKASIPEADAMDQG